MHRVSTSRGSRNIRGRCISVFRYRVCGERCQTDGRPRSRARTSSQPMQDFEVLAEGGNAFDAAVAVAAALSVLEPQSSGIGGGGLFLLRRASDGKEVMIDARETAPAAVERERLCRRQRQRESRSFDQRAALGCDSRRARGHSSGSPNITARLPLSKSLAPAIRLAREGFKPDSRMLGELAERKEKITRYPASAALYLPDGEAPKEGWVFKTPDLARVLEAIAAHGNDGFYRGELAKKLVDGVRAEGGHWTLDDLAGYSVKERRRSASNTAAATWSPRRRRRQAASRSPRCSIFSAATIFRKFDHAHRVHLAVEAMRRAYRDRAEYLGDPDFIQMPIARVDESGLCGGPCAPAIHPDKATPSDMLPGYLDRAAGCAHLAFLDHRQGRQSRFGERRP